MNKDNFYFGYTNFINSIEKKQEHLKVVASYKYLLPFPYIPYADIAKKDREKEIINSIAKSGEMFFMAIPTFIDEYADTKEKYHKVGLVCRFERTGQNDANGMTYFCNPIYFANVVNVVEENGFEYATTQPQEMKSDSSLMDSLVDKTRNWYFNYIDYANKKINPELVEYIKEVEDPFVMACLMMSTIDADQHEQYQFMEEENLVARLEQLCVLLNRLFSYETLNKNIDAKIKQDNEQHQKEAYIKERIKYLNKEIGEDDEFGAMEKKVKDCKMPKSTEDYVLDQIRKLSKIPPMAADYNVIKNYIETVVELPWSKYTTDNIDIAHARKVLDDEHYGLEKVKTRILEYLAVLKLNDKVSGQILCLVGAPGVGKTSIAKSVANALGRKFVKLTLGGVHDESEIRGHRKTYVGAMVGKIIYNIKLAGTNNPVFLLDEIDKLTSDIHGDPASALLEVLDPQQNATFRDNFLEVPYDLSKVIFIATANYVDRIPAPLRDRMEIINVDSYTANEKVEIAKQHLIPKQLKENGIKEGSLVISDDVLYHIIDEYTYEAGVRNLERLIAKICRQLAVKLVDNPDEKLPWVITQKMLPTLLNEPPVTNHGVRKQPEVGVGYGLGWSPYGGSILTLEGVSLKGKGNLVITGNLKNVMQESCKIAYTVAKRCVNSSIDYNKLDIHINACEGGVQKDGPSAGVVLALVIYSVLTNKKISNQYAMTGEISLTGQVYAIGGLREKLYACVQNGIKNVIVPLENKKDIKFVPSEITDKLNIHYVSTFDEVLKLAIVGDKNENNKKRV